MKSESIRKNLESSIYVTYTEVLTREDKYKEFECLEDAIKYARKIEETEDMENILYLTVELVIYNSSEENANVVFRQSIPYNI